VWADNQATRGTPDLHANFKLNKNGASIGLWGADGRPVDAINFGPQTSDLSQGRCPDGSPQIVFLGTPTPRAANGAGNTAPVLAPIGNQVLGWGETLSLTASATDTDQPLQTLTFSLGAGAPSGSALDPNSGWLTWTPSAAPSTARLTIIVTDNGTPSLTATQSFTATVLVPPRLANISLNANTLTFTCPTQPGLTYQLECSDDVVATAWTPCGVPLAGTGNSVAFANAVTTVSRQFNRLRVVP
jgi:hypothetical protein